MPGKVNRQWVFASPPEGMPSPQNFTWVSSQVPALKDGEFLVRTLWISVDPTQLVWMKRDSYVPRVPPGEPMRAIGVGQVVESRHPGYKVGELVMGLVGWQDYAVSDGAGLRPVQKVPPRVPPDLALGLFGITGLSAYFGVVDIGLVHAGETFVVSSAAGAVGSVAGQIAKIRGAYVVGIAGGPVKCDWIRKVAGFDVAIDYRSENVGARLSECCPKGIDVFFDNVGGQILDDVLARINPRARIVLCGAISSYATGVVYPLRNYIQLVTKRGQMQGFIVTDYAPRYEEAISALAGWLAEGRLKLKEDVVEGLENAPRALARLFNGENFGKQLLHVANPVKIEEL